MGIRLHELANELGVQSKLLVAFCKELKANGLISKEVRTASSSLGPDDEAIVRLEHASGAADQTATDEKSTPAFKPADKEPSPSPVRLMQSVATKPKGQSPTQLKRPESPPTRSAPPAPVPKPASVPPPEPEPVEPPGPEPQEPARAELEAEVRVAALPGAVPPESKVRVPSLPGAKKPEQPTPDPEVQVPALPGADRPARDKEPEPSAPGPPAKVAKPKPEPRAPAAPAAEKPTPKDKAAPPTPKATPTDSAADTSRAQAQPRIPSLPTAEPSAPEATPEPPSTKRPPRQRKGPLPQPEAKPSAAEPVPAPPSAPSAPSTPSAPQRPHAAVPSPSPVQPPTPEASTTQGAPDTTAPESPPVSAAPPKATPARKPVPTREAARPPVKKTPPTREDGAVPGPELLPGRANRPRRAEATERPSRPKRGRRGPERRPIPRPASSRPRPVQKDRKIVLQPPMSIKDISYETGIKAGDIIRKLLENNVVATINEVIDPESASTICTELGFEVEVRKARDVEDSFQELIGDEEGEQPGELVPRAPVVTLLGHVDHGKTSLLDSIRRTNVAEHESGGITQHIGAHQVAAGERFVTFLDTPGHEAFTAMRARGANCTDVVVLVVAADDGVMPQTEEAVSHARAANVPMVVAINKVDKPNANVMRTKQQLAAIGLNPEEWGGGTSMVEVSAVTGQGVANLLEVLALESELLELKSSPSRRARGVVLEAELSSGRGAEATLLVQEGTLRRGDVILCGQGYGRVRGMLSDKGRAIKSAGPSVPTAVSGLSTVPRAGDKFFVVRDLQTAKLVAEDRERRARVASLAEIRHVTLENLFEHIAQGKTKEVRVVLKADVQGSVEVLQSALTKLSTDEVVMNILHRGVGGITESDVLLADASDAVVMGFHVTPEDRARAMAEDKGVDVRLYQVIYMAIDDMKKAMEGMLDPEEREDILGHAEVRRVFRISRHGNIAGCSVRDGGFRRSALMRVVRDNVVIYSGRMQSLRIEKDDVREVRAGQECGIKIEGYDDVKEGDVFEAYEVRQVARTFDS